MNTRNALKVMLFLAGSTMAFPSVAGSYYDPNAGDSESNQTQAVEIHRDQQQSSEQWTNQLGRDAAQYGQGLSSGRSDEDSSNKIPIQRDRRSEDRDSSE
jgi:hypothetical protein